MNKITYLLLIIFVLNFKTDHHQIGVSRQIQTSCNLGVLSGTTLGIKEILIGRCHYFINVLQKENCKFDSKKYNCSLIWETFYSISLKNTKNIDNYAPFLDLVDHIIPENTSLFWSGTYTQAHECNFIMTIKMKVFRFLN